MTNIEVLKSSLFDANCYVIWPKRSAGALVVDPGPGTASQVLSTLERHDLKVEAVLLTHGHFDHVWDVAALVEALGGDIPIYIPGPDLFWLDDPTAGLGLSLDHLGLGPWRKPAGVQPIEELQFNPTEQITVRTVPAPGHSPGSSVFLLGAEGLDEPHALGGDVVFAGSVGRTDLPGGDEYEMRESLRTLAVALDPATVLLPGHGPATKWSEELRSNPYVLRAVSRA